MKTFHCRYLVHPAGKIIILSLVFLLFQFSASVSTAQTTTSTIEGTVTDPNGAAVAGATVKANGATLATERTTTTNADGFYRLPALPAGKYTITVSQTGLHVVRQTVL